MCLPYLSACALCSGVYLVKRSCIRCLDLYLYPLCCQQVSTSSYIMSSSHHTKSAKPRKDAPQKHSGLDTGGLVSVAAGKGVWISLVRHQGLRVCHSDITGAFTCVPAVADVEDRYQGNRITISLHMISPNP